MADIRAIVDDSTLYAGAESSYQALTATKRGELVVVDFYTRHSLMGHGYQIRAGTIATGVAMDSVTTDTAAEGCVDAATGTTVIPVSFNMGFDNIATATTVKVGIKAVGVVSSAGTAFVPLPMLQGGAAATSSARVANNGGVTVTAELATTTRRLFIWQDVTTETPATDRPGGGGGPSLAGAAASWSPRAPYIGKGPACVYIQAASTTAFPLYFFDLEYIEFPSLNL